MADKDLQQRIVAVFNNVLSTERVLCGFVPLDRATRSFLDVNMAEPVLAGRLRKLPLNEKG